MTKETGTLAELNVQPGDVVENVDSGKRPEIVMNNGEACYDYIGDGCGAPISMARQQYRLISRASDTLKTWGEMTDAEKGALLLERHEGKVIESSMNGEFWASDGSVGASPRIYYRIKPEPKRETVTLYSGSDLGWKWMGSRTGALDTHRITFDTLDGEPVLDTIRMEKIGENNQ